MKENAEMSEEAQGAAAEHAVAVQEALEADTGPHIHVFYRDCLDGQCAAAIINRHLDDRPDVLFAASDGHLDMQAVKEGETVYLLDLVLPRGLFLALLSLTDDIVWIDHHRRQYEPLYDDGRISALPGVRIDTLPGTALATWRYLYPHADPPAAVEYVNAWDTWTHDGDERVLAFVLGMETVDASPQSAAWSMLLESASPGNCDSIIEDGRMLLGYKQRRAARLLRSIGWEGNFEGLKAYCCNIPKATSLDFAAVAGKGYDVFVAYHHDGEAFRVTFYAAHTRVPHLGELVAKYGGGGHRQSADCLARDLYLLRQETREDEKAEEEEPDADPGS